MANSQGGRGSEGRMAFGNQRCGLMNSTGLREARAGRHACMHVHAAPESEQFLAALPWASWPEGECR